jgi:hypothetical protein
MALRAAIIDTAVIDGVVSLVVLEVGWVGRMIYW